MSFLIILLIVFAVLGVALVIVFVRLGRELQRLGDSTETMLAKTQRAVRTVQLIIPAIALMKKTGSHLVRRLSIRKQKGVKSHVKASRKK